MNSKCSLWVFGLIAMAVRAASLANPYNDENLVSMFDGTKLTDWTPNRSDQWVVSNDTIHGTGTSRGWIYYKNEVGTFRWIFSVRQIKGNHQPTVLIWGSSATPVHDALGAIQFQPPNGGHWDYRPGHNNGGGSLFTKVNSVKYDIHKWSQCELIANHTTGFARMACCQLTGDAPCKAVEVLRFQDKTAGRVGPLALQCHNSGIEDEFKDLYYESPVVKNVGEFITS